LLYVYSDYKKSEPYSKLTIFSKDIKAIYGSGLKSRPQARLWALRGGVLKGREKCIFDPQIGTDRARKKKPALRLAFLVRLCI